MEKSLSPLATAQSSSIIKDEKDKEKEAQQICTWIKELGDNEKRENALLQIRFAKTQYTKFIKKLFQ